MSDVMFRPSDNCRFVKGSDGKYTRGGEDRGRYGCGLDVLQSKGFRDYPFTDAEMQDANSIRVKCKINGSPSEIVISRNEWNRIFG